jgi:hypothetical protein
MWLLSHALLVSTYLIGLRFLNGPVPGIGRMLGYLAQWDGIAYVWVAEHGGYPPVTDPTFTHDPLSVYTTWPPLYPMVVWLFAHLLPGVSVASTAVIVSNLAGLGMLIVLSRLMDREADPAVADRTMLFLVAWPAAFFLSVAYSEALFLLLAFGALYLARQQRWWWAGLLAAGAGATRLFGVLIGVALAYEYLRQRDFKLRRIGWDVLALGLVPSGLAGYMIYLWQRYDDPLLFAHVRVFWGPQGRLWDAIADVFRYASGEEASIKLLDLGSVVMVTVLLVLGVVGPWRLRRDQIALWLFGTVLFAIPLMTSVGVLAGMNRYALAALPAFMVLAKMCKDRFAERLYLFAAIPMQAALIIQFIRFAWAD